MAELQVKQFASQKDWEKWLDKNHGQIDGVWLKFAKKNFGITTVGFVEAIEVALCYGWIDSHRKGLDHKFYLQKFSPRRARSTWSKINVGRVEALNKAGMMRPAGIA